MNYRILQLFQQKYGNNPDSMLYALLLQETVHAMKLTDLREISKHELLIKAGICWGTGTTNSLNSMVIRKYFGNDVCSIVIELDELKQTVERDEIEEVGWDKFSCFSKIMFLADTYIEMIKCFNSKEPKEDKHLKAMVARWVVGECGIVSAHLSLLIELVIKEHERNSGVKIEN